MAKFSKNVCCILMTLLMLPLRVPGFPSDQSIPPRIDLSKRKMIPTTQLFPMELQFMYAAVDSGLLADMWLVLNNNAPRSVDVDATFYSISGEMIRGNTTVLAANQVRRLPLSDLLPTTSRTPTDVGSICLSFLGQTMQIGAQITAVHADPIQGSSVDFPFPVMSDFRSRHQHATWWTPEGSYSRLIATNTSGAPLKAMLTASGNPGRKLELPPHGTEVIRLAAGPNHVTSARFALIGNSEGLLLTGYATLGDKLREQISFSDPKSAVGADLFSQAQIVL